MCDSHAYEVSCLRQALFHIQCIRLTLDVVVGLESSAGSPSTAGLVPPRGTGVVPECVARTAARRLSQLTPAQGQCAVWTSRESVRKFRRAVSYRS